MSNQASSQLGVDVPKIERDLRDLWVGMGGPEAVMRTCVLNLVAYAPGESVSDVSSALAEVSTEHPSRMIVLLPNAASPTDSMSAMVTAQCHDRAGGRQQICCEQIMVKAEGKGVAQLPSVVRPLLVPDLPAALWWRAEPTADDAVFKAFVDIADRVIVDSIRFADSAAGFRALAKLVEELRGVTAFSDMSWGRMGSWRRLVAGFYNTPDYRPHLARVGRVDIECGRSQTGQTGIPVGALLAACWLSSRLSWTPRSRFQWVDDNTCQAQLDEDGRTVVIRVQIGEGQPGIRSIRLTAGGSENASFLATYSDDRTHYESHAFIGDQTRAGSVIRVQSRSEAYLLARELEILGPDQVYEQALAVVDQLAN